MNLSDLFNKLFPVVDPAPGSTLSYELKRNDEFADYYKQWQQSVDFNNTMSAFRLGYESVITGNSVHDIIELPTQSMFIFNNENYFINPLHLHFLMDYFRQKLKGNGYRSYFSDLRISVFEDNQSRKIYRHYLKVAFDPTTETFPSNTLFGNIYLELVDEIVPAIKLRITCNYHQQRERKKEESIHKLVEFLLSE